MPVKLSVIIPVYNAEKYIGQCLDSILSSPLGDMELLVIDDGSGDKSFSICSHYARKDERVISLQKKNEGQSKTRNLGLKYAKGEYVTFATIGSMGIFIRPLMNMPKRVRRIL